MLPDGVRQALLSSLSSTYAALGPTKPYYIESFSTFGLYGSTGVPSGIANYTGGNGTWGVSGTIGDTFVTVTSGTFADASGKWAAVLCDDAGNWTPCIVLSNDGTNKLNITPPLASTITAGEIGNLHDGASGQHYTSRGYKALAQHIFNAVPKAADRSRYVGKFLGTATSGLTKTGSIWVDYNQAGNVYSGPLQRHAVRGALCSVAEGATGGIKKSFTVSGRVGMLEVRLAAHAETVAEFWADGVMVQQHTGLGSKAAYLTYDYAGADTVEIRVYVTVASAALTFSINEITCWESSPGTDPAVMFPSGSSIVLLGDSWGTYHSGALVTELRRLLLDAHGYPARVINKAVAGTTSKRGQAWFHDDVIQQGATHVIIEFFVNDANSVGGTNYPTVTDPYGIAFDLDIATRDEWRTRIRAMCALALAHGIQPVVLGPCQTAAQSQTQGLADWNVYLTEGLPL